MSNKNPYAAASGAYNKKTQETTPDQRQLEAHVLLKAANELQKLHDRWDEATPEDIENILSYNRKLWLMFFDAAIEDEEKRPIDLRNNIVNLANFVFKRSIAIVAEPERSKLNVLIEINRQIAAGLMQTPAQPASTEKSATQSSSDTSV